MGAADSAGFFFLKGDRVGRDIPEWRSGRPTCACFSFSLVSFDGRHYVVAVLRSAYDHVHSATIVVVPIFVMSSLVLFAKLNFLSIFLRWWGSISLWRSIGIADEILDTGDFENFFLQVILWLASHRGLCSLRSSVPVSGENRRRRSHRNPNFESTYFSTSIHVRGLWHSYTSLGDLPPRDGHTYRYENFLFRFLA